MQTATSIPTQPRPEESRTKPTFRWKRLILRCLGIIALIIIGLIAFVLVRPMPGEKKVPAGYMRNESRYLTMRDGVRIATDVWFPADLAPNQKAPAIIRSTRYQRTTQVNLLGRVVLALGLVPNPFTVEPELFNAAGYVLVQVDARGSGASYGSRAIEWSPDEVADLGEVIDWIVAQPWSNGKVGSYGVSYDGNAADVIAATQRPALKAVAPQFDDFDPQSFLAIPGGVFNQRFIQEWSNMNEGLDKNDRCLAAGVTGLQCLLVKLFNIGVKPVDGDRGRRQRAAAIAEHHNPNIYASVQGIEYRDDHFGESGMTLGEASPYGMRTAIEGSGAAMYVWVGWLDASTVNGALGRYLTFRNPQQLIIGPWQHGGDHHIDPFLPADMPTDPPVAQQQQMLLHFFDQFLKDQAVPVLKSQITYYVLGAGEWKTTNVWPPAGVQSQRWYFGPDKSLRPTAPTGQNDADEYKVDFTATTGDANRWVTQLGGDDVIYPDRAEEDKKLLTYTSEPLPADAEITGSPVVTLYVSSTVTDGAFHVYLEDVAPDGRVTYITEGILRAIHRKVSTAEPLYTQLGPYQSFLRADAAPLTLGKVETVPITLIATAVCIQQGHRIRVSVAGHDASMFRRYPAAGDVVLQVQRNMVYASAIDLPVLAQPC